MATALTAKVLTRRWAERNVQRKTVLVEPDYFRITTAVDMEPKTSLPIPVWRHWRPFWITVMHLTRSQPI
jgi:hypothetical protein